MPKDRIIFLVKYGLSTWSYVPVFCESDFGARRSIYLKLGKVVRKRGHNSVQDGEHGGNHAEITLKTVIRHFRKAERGRGMGASV